MSKGNLGGHGIGQDLDNSPLVVDGQKPLVGTVEVSGSKHSILHILGALWLLDGSLTINNVPDIWDVRYLMEIYKSLGMMYRFDSGSLTVNLNSSSFSYTEEEFPMASKFRSSILLLASLLVRNRYVKFPAPGGDRIGNRPFAEFFAVLEHFGVSYSMSDGFIEAKYDKPFSGDRTVNLYSQGNNRTALAIILAAANNGRTILVNPLPQPEIIELCAFINSFICQVEVEYFQNGAIKITVDGIGAVPVGCRGSYSVGPDKCELGFWIAATAITKGYVECKATSPVFSQDRLGPLAGIKTALLDEMGIPIEVKSQQSFAIDGRQSDYKPVNLVVPHNRELTTGLCIDVCPQFIPLMALTKGKSFYRDAKYGHSRVTMFLQELRRFGIVANLQGDTLEIHGENELHGTQVEGKDIRGMATLLIAALVAGGQSIVDGVFHLNRGYSGLPAKLKQLGAMIERKETDR